MGVNLKKIVPKHETSFKELKNQRIAIDAYNWLYQFLSIIRQPDGTPLMDNKGRVTSHLIGLFYRTTKLLEEGIKPCYVFDGKPSKLKIVIKDRIKRKEQAKKEYEQALIAGDYAKALSKASQTAYLTKEMVNESKQLLEAMGVPFIQALSEGEAQASSMVSRGEVDAVATQDYDALLFGAPIIIRNLNITGRKKIGSYYKTINPEKIILKEVLEQNGLTINELIMLGILIGTDFNPKGVKGIGPMKGLKLVKQYGVNAWQHVNHEWTVNPQELMNIFLNPRLTSDYELKWSKPDPERIKSILLDYDFSEERINNTLKRIVKATSQSGLNKFL